MISSGKFSDSVLVVGGGIAGIQAALDLADSNRKVVLVEKTPSIGGRMASLDKTFPTNDCSMCILAPKLIAVNRHPNIELLTNSEVLGVEGEAGDFNVKVKRKPRYIDEVACIGCGDCAEKCPVSVPDEFNQELDSRRAAYIPFPQAVPLKFALDRRAPSPCKVSCPANLSAQGYVALIAEGRYVEALQVVKDVMPFAGTIGRVCNHPCEFSCKRKDLEGSVSICRLKRFIADAEMKTGEAANPVMFSESNGRKIAIVGAGPAGITCAYQLRRLGYEPTIFEALPVTGGMLKVGIPDYRLPTDVLDFEIKAVQDMGVEIKTGVRIGKDKTLKELFDTGYEAVFVGVGAHESMKLRIEGEDSEGVLPGVEFLRDVNLGKSVSLGENVVVIGGGNVAIDAARSAWRLGAENVKIFYRRTRKEMPAEEEEIEEALNEGIAIEYLVAPTKIISEGGKVKTLECIRMELGEPDESGRRRPVPKEGTEFTVDIDSIIPAIGQASDLSFLEGLIDYKRTIEVNEDLSTSYPGLFAGGDVVTGPKMVIDAIAAGRKAAWSIDKYLNDGKNTAEPPLIEMADIATTEYYIPDDVEVVPRKKLAMISVDERKNNFKEVEIGYSDEDAKVEADRCLSCGVCARCGVCEIVCEAKAVRYGDSEKTAEYNVGSIVLAPGYECFDPSVIDEYGYSKFPDVVTALEFERILSASGPFAGHIKRLSDSKDPKKLAFIQCVGSRDKNKGNPYCSSVCCMYTIKEAVIAKEHSPELDITVFYMDIRAFGKEFDYYFKRAQEEVGIHFNRSRVASIEASGGMENEPGQYILNYTGEDDEIESEMFDMVVLSTGLVPNKDTVEFAKNLGIKLNEHNYATTDPLAPLESSREGVFACGAFSEPKDIPETIAQASGAAGTAMLYSVPRSAEEVVETGPEAEMLSPDVWAADQEPRIGVIVCKCGINIAKVVKVSDVAQYASTLPGVVVAEDAIYSCSQDVQEKIKKLILEHKLNRFVVASCTPRTHEPLFQETLKEVGLNPYLFELVNIREHCSWVHMNESDRATDKAKDLVRKAVARVSMLEPLEKAKIDIIKSALVLGGGPAGMTAASALGKLGYKVHLLESSGELGGNLRNIHTLPSGKDPQEFLKTLKAQVEQNKNIQVFTNSEVKDLSGHIGHFTTKFSRSADDGSKKSEEIEDGVIIVATGGSDYQPIEYLYKESDNVILQREFEEQLVNGKVKAGSVAMIQCVGSRSDEFGWCSRVCCTEAIKNALHYKENNPEGEVYILYKDIRTYGFKEEYYDKASSLGVKFIRFNDSAPPKLEQLDGGKLKLIVNDILTGEELELNPEICVLSAGIHPNETNASISEMLKVPLNRDGFFLEAHMKLRPLDFYTEGVFLCGLAHSPKTLDEALAQAYGAVARANTVLSKDYLEIGGIVASVEEEKCAICLTCIRVCPFQVPAVNENNVAYIEVAKCQGCGVCVAECPAKAIQLAHFKDKQVLAETDALLAAEEGES